MTVNNENSAEIVDLEALASPEEGIKDEPTQLTDTEQKAFDQGWRPLEEFSGPEDNWKTAKEYVRDGEFLSTIKELGRKVDNQKKDFDARLDNSNKLHEARRKQEIKDLKAAQRTAVDAGDTEAFDAAGAKIETLEDQPNESTTKPVVDPSVAEWEAANPWIQDQNDERTPVAQGIWNHYASQNPNATALQAIAHVEAKITKLFPPSQETNVRRGQPNLTENNQRKSTRQSKELSMNDLTQDEMKEWDMFGSQMFSEKEFLKTVKDTRAK